MVIPTYNEAEEIQRLCRSLAEIPEVEKILVVDDASPDGTAELAEALAMSRRQLDRKLKALIGQTPGSVLRRRRMAEAGALLEAGALTVKEVCYGVGFQNLSSFSRAFREAYGVPPSDYYEQVHASGPGPA